MSPIVPIEIKSSASSLYFQIFEVMHTKERQHILINIIIYAGFTLIKNSKNKKIIDQKIINYTFIKFGQILFNKLNSFSKANEHIHLQK